MAKFHVTRVRKQLEGIVVEAPSQEEAVSKSKKTLRKDWVHIDSTRRSGYRAEDISGRVRE